MQSVANRKYYVDNHSEPAPRLYSPGVTNLRLSAFICGSSFAGTPDSKDADRINRMDRINPSTDPVNPVYPVQSGSYFSAAPDINLYEFIKVWTSQNSSPQSHNIPPSRAGSEPVLCWFRYKSKLGGNDDRT